MGLPITDLPLEFKYFIEVIVTWDGKEEWRKAAAFTCLEEAQLAADLVYKQQCRILNDRGILWNYGVRRSI